MTALLLTLLGYAGPFVAVAVALAVGVGFFALLLVVKVLKAVVRRALRRAGRDHADAHQAVSNAFSPA